MSILSHHRAYDSHPAVYDSHPVTKEASYKRFIHWCDDQQDSQFMWLGITLMGHGAALTPLTLAVIFLTGFNFTLVIVALLSIGMAVISNLAAMPTKVTIPVLLVSAFIDLGIIVTCLIKAI